MKRPLRSSRMCGFSLIELMVGLLLGLIVTGAAIAVFLSNQNAYRSTEGLGRVQEGMRTAFELMAQDLRAAGSNGCNNSSTPTNGLTLNTGNWWAVALSGNTWTTNALTGYEQGTDFDTGTPSIGSSTGSRVSATDAVQLFSAGDVSVSVAADDGGSAFTVNSSDHDFVASDMLLVCDANYAAVFNATSVSGTSIGHPTFSHTYYDSAQVATLTRLNAVRWYVAYNSDGGTSLYRSRVYAGAEQTEEVVADVSDLQLTYLVSGATSYVAASAVSDWSAVTAVRIELTVDSPDKVGTDGKVLSRELVAVVELRNRLT
ncbi:MAG: PilW family protein [Pseudomonas sp.]